MKLPAYKRAVILLFLVLTLLLAATLVFRGTGRWLVRENALAPSDVIVVLSGSMPYRAEEAARVFQMGYASQVWVSRPGSAAEELNAMGIRYLGEEDYNRRVLIRAGVPESAIRIFPYAIADTEEEIEEVSGQMREQGKSSVIIVTSPEHTRRVRALWKKIAPGDLKLIVHAAPQDGFDANRWWRNTRDALAVMREILGLLNVWAGLPVRPNPASVP